MDSKELEMVQFASAVISVDSEYKLYKRRFVMAAFFAFSTVLTTLNQDMLLYDVCHMQSHRR